MHATFASGSNLQLKALTAAVALALVAGSAQAVVTQSAERKNMNRLGHTDLQGRPSYQPNVIQYPDGRTILFVGMHSGNPRGLVGTCPNNTLPNPLHPGNPSACDNNGTMIIDVSDPNNPQEKFLIPAPTGAQAQMARMCLGADPAHGTVGLPNGTPGHVYLLRNTQANNFAVSGYEVWDVTDVTNPVMTSQVRHLRSTHKLWWECSTGIMYAPGSQDATLTPTLWRQSQSMVIYDWSNPNATPTFIRAFGLPGQQPNGTGTVPNSLHGPISAHDHPRKNDLLARGQDVIGNRIYAAWGVGDDGVMTIIDRNKLLPAAYGGSWVPKKADSAQNPDEDELIGPNSPTVGYYLMSPDEGGHTSMPVFGLLPPSFQKFNEFQKRDIVLLASEATADGVSGRCNEAPHATYVVDVTVENGMGTPNTIPKGSSTRLEHDPYQGPMGLSTLWVDPRFGERYPRGNYCARGARFGTHSTEENFANPYYGKLTAVAYFNGGVRMYDIREPYKPAEVAFYVTEANANTNPDGYMTNNVEIDNRGYVYIVDRNGAGMDILQPTGCVQQIVSAGSNCPRID